MTHHMSPIDASITNFYKRHFRNKFETIIQRKNMQLDDHVP